MPDYRLHPSTKNFSALTQDEMDKLRDSIAKDGCRYPLLIWRSFSKNEQKEIHFIMDGAHRYQICQELRKSFLTNNFNGTEEEPVQLAKMLNEARRHRPTVERAFAAARKMNAPPGRPPAEGSQSEDEPSQEEETVPNGRVLSESNKTAQQAAEEENVGLRTTRRASTVLTHGTPELQKATEVEKVIPLADAAEIARQSEEQQQEAVRQAGSGTRPRTTTRKKTKKELLAATNGQEVTDFTLIAKMRKILKTIKDELLFESDTGPIRDAHEVVDAWEALAEARAAAQP
jgi:hypothetical protein